MLAATDDLSLLVALLGPVAATRAAALPLAELLELEPRQLAALGLGRAARRRLSAGAELARRFQPACRPPVPVRGPRDALPHLRALRRLPTEVLAVLPLDARGVVLGGLARVAEGGVAALAAEPREVFLPALERRASSLVLAHNHPSGVVEPSPEDLDFTGAMCRAGLLLAIPVLDHLVVAARSYFSFVEAGLM